MSEHYQKTVTVEPSDRGPSDVQDRGFIALIGVLALIYAGAFLYFVQATIIRTPVLDMLGWIDGYLAYRSEDRFWAYLWSYNNQNRLIWVRLITVADIELFKGIIYPFVVLTTACLVAPALLMQREARTLPILPGVKAVGGLLAAMLILTAANAVDCSTPAENIYPHTLAFAVLSLVLFNSGDFSTTTSGIARWGAALLAAIASAFGAGVGLVVWPVLAWMGWRRQLGWRLLLATVGIGAAFVVLYAHGLPIPKVTIAAVSGGGDFYAPAHLYRIVMYLLTYMGLPWTRSAPLVPVGRVIGAALLAAGVFVVTRRGFARPPADRLERLSIGLIMFSLAAAALAVLGRVDQDLAVAVPVRYAVFLAPLHVGLLFLTLPWLNRWWSDAGYRGTCKAAILGIFALLLVQQIQAGRAAVRITDAIRVAAEMPRAMGQQPVGENSYIAGTPEYTQRIENLMRENNIYTATH